MHRKSPAPLALLMVVLALGLLAVPGFAADAGVVAVQLDNARVEWAPQQGQETDLLSVAGPDGFRWTEEFSGSASMSIFDANGQVLPDGFYNYELRAVVQVPEALRQKMQEIQRTGDADLRAELEAQLPAPAEPVIGSFRILDGALVRGDLVEPPAAGPRRVTGTPDALRSSETPEAIELDQVIPDDLIVQGSICVGFDCVNNENFGFDTVDVSNLQRQLLHDTADVGRPKVESGRDRLLALRLLDRREEFQEGLELGREHPGVLGQGLAVAPAVETLDRPGLADHHRRPATEPCQPAKAASLRAELEALPDRRLPAGLRPIAAAGVSTPINASHGLPPRVKRMLGTPSPLFRILRE